ncbi:4'-phosphopantetheinyl transferase superfamily protein [Streptomyces sp. AC512_CC834]|uniref:4'-phosphopantetheinyl transferase family protein n=1 Tax=Streptomyces sp. AC512_CC834 TaxID=2823691 RepID=UPI001C256F23|nr:4'-phosphopantetheinyl transferase superfamily protein [Streptomyces sp. AC512_CC834]
MRAQDDANRAVHGPPPGQTHVWAVPEPGPGPGGEAVLRRCAAFLPPDELARLGHLVASQRALYASAHAALRGVTAAYAGVHWSQVAFVRGTFGKPYVRGRPGLRVSLAHTGGMSLIAVSRDGPVGVDVERIVPLRDPAGMRRQILSDWEADRWPTDREDAAHTGLFAHWTCKEAVLKAIGSGLAGDLTAVRVTPGARRAGPVPVHAAPGAPTRRWTVRLVDLGPHYRAAVAVTGGGEDVRVRTLTPGARLTPSEVAAVAVAGGDEGDGVPTGAPEHVVRRPPSPPTAPPLTAASQPTGSPATKETPS